jgi:hypothetical protein
MMMMMRRRRRRRRRRIEKKEVSFEVFKKSRRKFIWSQGRRQQPKQQLT